jgi:hypothetical protein
MVGIRVYHLLRHKVTVKNEDPYNVAKHYLEKEGLVK